jgi:hypothetical protein
VPRDSDIPQTSLTAFLRKFDWHLPDYTVLHPCSQSCEHLESNMLNSKST